MNRKQLILWIGGLLCSSLCFAQEVGTVAITQDATLETLLYQNKQQSASSQEEALTAAGYRVQIYSSNLSRQAKEMAQEWKKTIESTFVGKKAYITYQAPFWKVRVGDFTHYAEAVMFSKELKQTYPKEAGEIIVVKEKQVKPIYFEPKVAPAIADSTLK